MLHQTLDPEYYRQKVRQIKEHVPMVLAQRGLLPKFKSWRLMQDPGTGLVVLFGSLNEKYIATQGQTPTGAYFDPLLLLEMATDLQVQVIPSDSDGMRYAFILHRGHRGEEAETVDLPNVKPGLPLAETTMFSRPIILVWAEQVVAARPIETHRLRFPTRHRNPKTYGDYPIVTPASLPPTLPWPGWESKNDGRLIRLERTARTFVRAGVRPARIGHPLGVAQMILTQVTTTQ